MIERLNKNDQQALADVVSLLQIIFPWCYGEETQAFEEAYSLLEPDRIAFVAKEDGRVVGIVGAIKQYGETGWELHPLAVCESFRGRNIAKKLVETLEEAVCLAGGIVIYLGTDDELFKTSLSKVDLFVDTFKHIDEIQNYQNHPYSFYQKMGYKIVGVIPDANGINKPDIFMAKRLIEL